MLDCDCRGGRYLCDDFVAPGSRIQAARLTPSDFRVRSHELASRTYVPTLGSMLDAHGTCYMLLKPWPQTTCRSPEILVATVARTSPATSIVAIRRNFRSQWRSAVIDHCSGSKSACDSLYLFSRYSPEVTGGYFAGLSLEQQVGKQVTTVSKSGSKKNGIEYRSASPEVRTRCRVDLKRPLDHRSNMSPVRWWID